MLRADETDDLNELLIKNISWISDWFGNSSSSLTASFDISNKKAFFLFVFCLLKRSEWQTNSIFSLLKWFRSGKNTVDLLGRKFDRQNIHFKSNQIMCLFHLLIISLSKQTNYAVWFLRPKWNIDMRFSSSAILVFLLLTFVDIMDEKLFENASPGGLKQNFLRLWFDERTVFSLPANFFQLLKNGQVSHW